MSNDARTAADLLRLYYRALDTRDIDAIEDLFSPDAEWRMPGRRYAGAAEIRQGNERTLASGVVTHHRFVHLLEGDGVAIGEVEGDNHVGDQAIKLHGAVIVEARGGKITRFTVYPDASEYAVYAAARDAAARGAAR